MTEVSRIVELEAQLENITSTLAYVLWVGGDVHLETNVLDAGLPENAGVIIEPSTDGGYTVALRLVTRTGEE